MKSRPLVLITSCSERKGAEFLDRSMSLSDRSPEPKVNEESTFTGDGYDPITQHNVLAAYRQGSRAITNESIWYFVLRPMGLTKPGPEWQSSGAPHSADTMVVVVQLALLVVLVMLALLLRGQLEKAFAVAALAPAVLLLTNKVFSVQFLVVLTAAWAFAAASEAR